MGCLNSRGQFDHWFGNIHFSGKCNRSCYFCIGQHMMVLDPLNNLAEWPLKNIGSFIERCLERNVKEINLTGSNTDPLLYKHIPALVDFLRQAIRDVKVGIRTNGAKYPESETYLPLFDKVSISITSFDPALYRATMGSGNPPHLRSLIRDLKVPVKVNVVLCPETVTNGDYIKTLFTLAESGIEVVNLREPYGQPHIGDPLEHLVGKHDSRLAKIYGDTGIKRLNDVFGMPSYDVFGMRVTYWDVHYVEVESVNLYANGVVSETYPITQGHDPVTGKVEGQEHFTKSGRVREQWTKA
jgi:pyruvate-formate lyase-activating enzyme